MDEPTNVNNGYYWYISFLSTEYASDNTYIVRAGTASEIESYINDGIGDWLSCYINRITLDVTCNAQTYATFFYCGCTTDCAGSTIGRAVYMAPMGTSIPMGCQAVTAVAVC
jgi:hypothetical protein